MAKKKSVTRIVLWSLLISLFLYFVFLLYGSNYALESTYYKIDSDRINSSFRVVQLTDIHGATFGNENVKLVKKVEEEEPDIILITGDLINCKEKNQEEVLKKAKTLISELVKIAPIYISYGNQEESFDQEYDIVLADIYEKSGATVLRNEYTSITVNGQSICLGGIYGYCQEIRYSEVGLSKDLNYMFNYEANKDYKLLMCHMPVCWLGNGLNQWDIDVVFAGHVHGGQIRIPFIGGLWAPDQGWFPGKECGIYKNDEQSFNAFMEEMAEWTEKEEGKEYAAYYANKKYSPSYMILSRGLGNTDWIPRFNNVPEIVVVDFLPQ